MPSVSAPPVCSWFCAVELGCLSRFTFGPCEGLLLWEKPFLFFFGPVHESFPSVFFS